MNRRPGLLKIIIKEMRNIKYGLDKKRVINKIN